MGRSGKEDGRPTAGPATGDALKTALRGALAAKGDSMYQGKNTSAGAPTSPPAGPIAAGIEKLTKPTSNIDRGIAANE